MYNCRSRKQVSSEKGGKQQEGVSECVCVCEREREREREPWSLMLGFHFKHKGNPARKATPTK